MPKPWEKYGGAPAAGPITLGHPDPYKARDQQLQEDAAARAREDQQFQREKFNREMAKPDPATAPKPIPPGAASGIQANLESLRAVDSAIEALKTRPSSIGPGTGALGDTFTQFNDPEGTDVRSRVGNIGAIKIHDLSGAAVSPTEAPRFQPFVPTVTDRPEVAEQKLRQFREALRAQIKESIDYYGPANGYHPYKTPQAEALLNEPADLPQVASTVPTEKGFGAQQDPRLTELSAPQKTAYQAWWGANPNPTPEQLQTFLGTMGIKGKIANAQQIIDAHKRGEGLSSDIQTTPDISDVRGGANTPMHDASEAGIRGIADTPTLGTIDKVIAGTDTLFKGGTMQENLARQYAISDYDTQNHPGYRMFGQAVGGGALPMGEVSSIGNLALKGAAYGAAYGAGSSRTLADVPQNAFLGGLAGAAIPVGLAGAGRGIGAVAGRMRGSPAEVPALVDPVSGELNQPLDAMRPADRVAAMRGYGMETITPGMAGGRSARVLEQGLNNLPGSAGVMEDVNAAASKEVRRAAQGVAGQFGSSKTMNEGGSELQRGAKEWMTRFDEATSKAYNAIPISPKAPTNLNATTTTLQTLAGKVESNPDLAEEIKDPTLARYLDAIYKNGLDWQGLKEFRTFVGNKIGQFRFSEDARTGDYRSLYAALSEDMRASASAQGPQALRAFERANSIKAQGEARIEGALSRLLGPEAKGAPEKAAAAVQAMTKGGKSTGDLRTLAQIKASTVKSGAWDEIASTLIHLGGQPANSEGRAFNPKTFVDWYADMAEPARRMLFKPEQRKALDGFVGVAQQIGRVKGLSNTSNTTPSLIGSSAVGGAGVATAMGHPLALVGIVGGAAANYGMAKAWTNPTFVNIVTGYARAAARGNQGAVKSQVGRLTKLATTNPELRSAIEAMLKNLNDNSPLSQVAASPDAQTNQNQ